MIRIHFHHLIGSYERHIQYTNLFIGFLSSLKFISLAVLCLWIGIAGFLCLLNRYLGSRSVTV